MNKYSSYKKHISRIVQLSIVIFSILLSDCSGQQRSCPCTDEVIKAASYTYLLADPIFGNPQELTAYIQHNSLLFKEDGKAIKCLQRLSSVFKSSAIRFFSENDFTDARGRIINMGATSEQADKAIDDLTRGAVDMSNMGEELQWLSVVLPSASNGDWTLFNTTGTDARNTIRYGLSVWGPFLNIDPSISFLFQQMVQQSKAPYGEIIEYQLMIVAVITCNN